jgi:hypothetical protein
MAETVGILYGQPAPGCTRRAVDKGPALSGTARASRTPLDGLGVDPNFTVLLRKDRELADQSIEGRVSYSAELGWISSALVGAGGA